MKMYLLESLRDVAKSKKGKKHLKHEQAESPEEEREEDKAEGGKVKMKKKDFKKEHKNLLKVLRGGKKKDLRREAKKQKEEMREKE